MYIQLWPTYVVLITIYKLTFSNKFEVPMYIEYCEVMIIKNFFFHLNF